MAKVTNIGRCLFQGFGESPYYDAATDELFMVDIPGDDLQGRVLRRKYTNGNPNAKTEVYRMNGHTSFVVPTKSGKFLVGLDKTIVELFWPRIGAPPSESIIASVEQDLSSRFNDGKCDPRGRLVTGTISVALVGETMPEEGICSLYGFDKDKSIRVLAPNYTLSNGLAFSKDERTLFSIDSLMWKVYAFDYDAENVTATNQRVLLDFKTLGDHYGMPDGCCIDADDRLWIACFFGGRLLCVNTTTGQIVTEVSMPTATPTSCCFAGPNFDQLVVTSAKLAAPPSDKQAGSLFLVTNIGAKGRPVPKFEG